MLDETVWHFTKTRYNTAQYFEKGNFIADAVLRAGREFVVAVGRWKEEDSGHAVLRWQEYTELLGELSGEIQSWLEAMEEGSHRTNGEAS